MDYAGKRISVYALTIVAAKRDRGRYRMRPLTLFGKPGEIHTYAGLAEIAAAYTLGISRAHASVDGKRTAFVTALTFLRLNGFSFRPDPIEGVRIMDNLVAGEVTETSFAKWLSFGKTRV